MNNPKSDIFNILEEEESENPELETNLLCKHLSETSQNSKSIKSIPLNEHLEKHLKLIRKKIPIQRQLGFTEIMGMRLKINNNVLLPGPEMEILLNACINNITHPKLIIDLCTGSGAIANILGKKFKQTEIYATDISAKALNIAKINARRNNINNIHFLRGNLFQPIQKLKLQNVDLIVSNPPYCKSKDIDSLPLQIKLFTPKIAIDGGLDGLYFHKIIIDQSRQFLKQEGYLILENETGQTNLLKHLLIKKGYRIVKTYKNTKNEDRVIVAKKIK